MQDLRLIILRSIVSIGVLFILTKMMGRKELSQLSIFDYIVGISIGSIGAQMAFDIEENWYDFLAVMLVYVAIHYATTILEIKSLWARKFFDGAPIILMQDGKVINKNLRRVRYDVNTFLEACRQAGYFDINAIHMAIMESSGRISFLPKTQYRTVQMQDLGLETLQETLVANLIIDGKVMKNNIIAIGKSEKWLIEQLDKYTNLKIPDILLATYNPSTQLKIYLKNEKVNLVHCLE